MNIATAQATDNKTAWYRLGNHRGRKLAYIKQLCQQIAEAFHPDRIILFGS